MNKIENITRKKNIYNKQKKMIENYQFEDNNGCDILKYIKNEFVELLQ